MERRDVVIIGGGPAGLAAAGELTRCGVGDVVVLEREADAGGIPRHCGHLGFGWQSHRRIWSGPRFAAQLRDDSRALDVRTGATVLALKEGGGLSLRNISGTFEMVAKRVLIATGARETPRSARLIGGSRPRGVMNTGALQQHVYLHGRKPFSHPVIIGSEWVSYSALMTCRHIGITPAAMIACGSPDDAPRAFDLGARLFFGVPVLRQTRPLRIEGRRQVEALMVSSAQGEKTIACDGVVVSGRFRPENSLYAEGPFVSADLAPLIDGQFRCSDPAYFAAGNVLRPLKTSGACWQQGVAAARAIAESLR